MIIDKNPMPKSSFLSVEKDMHLISNMLLKNSRLKKLLYYTTSDCLSKSELTEDQSIELFGKNISLVPKIKVDSNILNYIIIRFDEFTPNSLNTEFRDNIVEFDIICHVDQWSLKDFQLRPYRIAAEIDSMFNEKHLTGIGVLNFVGAKQININDEYMGLCLIYAAIHGEEDKRDMPNPRDQEQFEKDFKEMIW